jgi:MFS family permease
MKSLIYLAIGNGVSTFGTSAFLVVVLLLLKDLTGSGTLLGFYQFFALLPAALFLPVSGALVDRLPKRGLIIGSDLFRGLVMLAVGGLWLVPSARSPLILLIAAFLTGAANALFVPSVQAVIPQLVPTNELERANGIRQASNQLSNLAGNAIGGLVYALVLPPVVFLANGISFLISALQESFIDLPAHVRPGGKARSLLASSREGLGLVKRSIGLRRLMISQIGLFAVSPPVIVSLPFLVEDRLGAAPSAVGFVLATMLAGAVIAFLLLSRYRAQPTLVDRLAYGLIAGCLFLVALVPSLPALFAAAFVSGAGAGGLYISVSSTIQRDFDPAYHGRIFAIIEAGSAIVAPLVFVLSGVAVDAVSPAVERVYWFAAIPAALWAARLWLGRRKRPYDLVSR